MRVGFCTVFRRDPQHFLHATALVHEIRLMMPGTDVVQLTDDSTPVVSGVTAVRRRPHGPMLERRLEHYAACEGEWLLLDTDVSLAADVRNVFDDPTFDVAFADREWPHLTPDQNAGEAGSRLAEAMPVNTGVAFSRRPEFWQAVLATWQGFTPEQQASWYSEQQAVSHVLRHVTGFMFKLLPGMVYNYPPLSKDDRPETAKLLHYKGQRKAWRTQRIYDQWRTAA